MRASPAAARYLFAGEKRTVRMGFIKPARLCARRRVLLLKRWMVPFWWPDAVNSPLGLMSTARAKEPLVSYVVSFGVGV